MKKFVFFLGILFTLVLGNPTFAKNWMNLINKKIDWKKVKVIQVNLDSEYKIITSVSQNWERFEDLVQKVWWDTGINWAYFCPADYGRCNGSNTTTSDRIYDGKVYSQYWNDLWARWLFGFKKNWKHVFVLNNKWYVAWLNKQYNNWKMNNLYYGISNFPVLLFQWKNVVRKSKNLIDKKMEKEATKNFICADKSWKKIYMWNIGDIGIYSLPDFLKKNFNCYNAVNLDSWGSLGLMYKWVKYNTPWREIMDAFVVLNENSEQYKSYLKQQIKKEVKDILFYKSEKTLSKVKISLKNFLKNNYKLSFNKKLVWILQILKNFS